MFAYRLAEFIGIGPDPTPQDELVFILANEATKRRKGWRNGSREYPEAEPYGAAAHGLTLGGTAGKGHDPAK